MKFKLDDEVVMVRPINQDCARHSGEKGKVVRISPNLEWITLNGGTYAGSYSPCQFDLVTAAACSTSPDSTPRRVYVSTPLKPQKFRLSLIQEAVRKAGVFAFIPTTVDSTPEAGAAVNKLQIELCDEVWVFGPIGRDCSWEIGYAQGLKKPVKFFATEENKHMVTEDWMLFCAGTEVVNE